MKTIQFLAASDRNNYGDLLFPIITKKIILESCEVKFESYALIDSNLNYFGALPTKSYKKMEKENNSNSIVIVGGGHVFFPKWSILYGHINKKYLTLNKNRFINKIFRIIDFPRLLFTKSKIPSPFAPYQLSGKLVYLSVGGNYNNYSNNKKVMDMLRKTSLLSIRDRNLYQQLEQSSYNVKLIPDTAVILSALFAKNELTKRLNKTFNFNIKPKYIIVQLGLHKDPTDKIKFVKNINLMSEKGFRVLLMPIGLAADHEDYKVLKPFLKLDFTWEYYLPKNIYEIMFLISQASFFFGTSLHGCITSFSYGTPFIPLNKRVKKLHNYTQTWWHSFLPGCIDYCNLNAYIKNEIPKLDVLKMKNAFNQQKKMVNESYDQLEQIINQD